MELEFGDDYTEFTGCVYPGLMGGSGGDCARAFLCVPSCRPFPRIPGSLTLQPWPSAESQNYVTYSSCVLGSPAKSSTCWFQVLTINLRQGTCSMLEAIIACREREW